MDCVSAFINTYCDINIILSKDNENERFDYLNSYFTKHKIECNYHNVKYDYSDKKEYTRAKNYLNVLKSCFKKKKDFILVIESDCLFMSHFLDQLYNVCIKILNSGNRSMIINFSKFDQFATTCLLYTKSALNSVNLVLPEYSNTFSYYTFLDKFRKDVIVKQATCFILLLLPDYRGKCSI